MPNRSDLRPLSLLLASAVLLACGPGIKETRQYLVHSPHRTIVLYPLDRQGGERDATPQATASLESKLRNYGWVVIGRGKTQVVYSSSTLRGRSYSEAAQAVELVRSWKVQAVLLGEIRGAYERIEKVPEEARFDPMPPPVCCANPRHPCASYNQYDAKLKTYVPQCGGWNRKVVIMRAHNDRVAGMTVRLRLVETATKKIIWETAYEVPREYGSLGQLTDRVTNVLVDQLSQAYIKQGF